MGKLNYLKIPLTAEQVAAYDVPRNRGLIDVSDKTLRLVVLPNWLTVNVEELSDSGVEYGAGGAFVLTSNEQRSFSLTTVESRADVVSLLKEIKAAAESQTGTQQLVEVRDYIWPTKSDRELQGYTSRMCLLMSIVENGATIRASADVRSPRYGIGGFTVEFIEIETTSNPGYAAASWS